jgi:hypothetical protein
MSDPEQFLKSVSETEPSGHRVLIPSQRCHRRTLANKVREWFDAHGSEFGTAHEASKACESALAGAQTRESEAPGAILITILSLIGPEIFTWIIGRVLDWLYQHCGPKPEQQS